jgi:hypothetical protein
MIQTKTYPIQDLYLTKGVISSFTSRFWNEEYSLITSSENQKYLMLLVKVQFTEESLGHRTLGHLRKVNFEDKNPFIDYIVERLSILNDSYTSNNISKIIFTYIVKEGIATGTRTLLLDIGENETVSHRFNNMNLPATMIPSEYGVVRGISKFDTFVRHFVTNNKKLFQIDVSLDKLINNVTLIGASDLKWIDTVVYH